MSIRDFYDTDKCKGCGRKAPDGTTWSSGFCPECSSPHKRVTVIKKKKLKRSVRRADGNIDCAECGKIFSFRYSRDEEDGEIIIKCPHCGTRLEVESVQYFISQRVDDDDPRKVTHLPLRTTREEKP